MLMMLMKNDVEDNDDGLSGLIYFFLSASRYHEFTILQIIVYFR